MPKKPDIPPPVPVHNPAATVPGPSPNPASNLIIADIIIRMGSVLLRHGVERAFLRGRYGKGTAGDIIRNRSLAQTAASFALSRLGTRSLPGAALVGAGMVAKTLYDRSQARRQAARDGDAALIEQAHD